MKALHELTFDNTFARGSLLDATQMVEVPAGVPVSVQLNLPINAMGLLAVWQEPAGGYEPAEKMTRQQALRSYTLDAAYGAFEEDIKGSIEVGKLADFAILSRDIMMVPDNEILGTTVEMTILGGKVVYKREEK